MNPENKEPRIVLFLGAGASAADPIKFPTTSGLLERLERSLSGSLLALYKSLLHIEHVTDVEYVLELLPELRKLSLSPLNSFFEKFPTQVPLLSADSDTQLTDVKKLGSLAHELREKIESELLRIYSLEGGQANRAEIVYKSLFEGILNKTNGRELVIFTTNFDTVIEQLALNSQYGRGKLQLVDGFDLSTTQEYIWKGREAFENPNKTDKISVKLLKLHGSISWLKRRRDEQVIKVPTPPYISRERPDREYDSNVLIYPVRDVAKEIDAQPFSTLYELFYEYMESKCDVCVIIGSSLRDYAVIEGFRKLLESSHRRNPSTIMAGKVVLVDPADPKPGRTNLLYLAPNYKAYKTFPPGRQHSGLPMERDYDGIHIKDHLGKEGVADRIMTAIETILSNPPFTETSLSQT